MKKLFCVLLMLTGFSSFAREKRTGNYIISHKEYHVSVNGNDANDDSAPKPFKTIMAAKGEKLELKVQK